MFFADEEQAIRSRWLTLWPIAQPAVPMSFPGVIYNPVNGTPYVQLDHLPGQGTQITLGGNPTFRFAGVIQITILTPPGTGMLLARQLADSAASIWRNAIFAYGSSGRILCRVPSLIGPRFDAQWTRTILSTSYIRDGVAGSVAPSGDKPQFHVITGNIDGVNRTFVLDAVPDLTVLMFFWNGLLMHAGDDYTIAGATITTVRPPAVGDNLVTYF